MSVSLYASGTQSATVGTTYTLASADVAGVFVFVVSKANMQSGDTLILTILAEVLTGDTPAIAYQATFTGAPASNDIIAFSIPVPNDLTDATSLVFKLEQSAGTGRNFKWKVLQM